MITQNQMKNTATTTDQTQDDYNTGKQLVMDAIISAIKDGNRFITFHSYDGTEKFTVNRVRVHEAKLGSSTHARSIKAALDHLCKHIVKPNGPIKSIVLRPQNLAIFSWKLEINPDIPDKITALKKLFGQD